MNLAVFCYDFPHAKTIEGLLTLKTFGYDNVTCIAAPKVEVNITPSPTRITPITYPLHPKDVAKALGFTYIVIKHHSLELSKILSHCEAGVILGARVLPAHVVNALPIVNMHPGWLPENRGLDNIKWAILDQLPQAVTTHIIDRDVDKGTLINRAIVDVFHDDTMLDIFLRLQSLQMSEMIEAIPRIEMALDRDRRLGAGKYNQPMTYDEDTLVNAWFQDYKVNYESYRR